MWQKVAMLGMEIGRLRRGAGLEEKTRKGAESQGMES